jgi:hypothetical protein
VSISRSLLAVAALAAALALAGRTNAVDSSPSSLELRSEMRSAVATIAGAPVRVRCTIRQEDAGLVEALGHASWERHLIELAPRVCRDANALVTTPGRAYSRASFAQAQALLVVVHESVHLSEYEGGTDEALTECRAVQLVRETAVRIGVDDGTARALGHEALRFDARLPGPGDWRVGLHEIPSYHSQDCYDGGPLDIHPDSSDWPN